MENQQKSNICFGGGAFYRHPSTVWEPIKNEIIAMIIKGVLQKGDKITSIAETAAKFNCCKSTAQKVLDSLCQENILCKIHGKGYYVSNTIEDKIKEIKEDYTAEADRALQRYISMAEAIGWNEENIIKRAEEYCRRNLYQKG